MALLPACNVIEGTIHRNNQLRYDAAKRSFGRALLSSLKRVKEDVREVSKGFECGIVLNGFNEVQVGDIFEAYEITYITQEL